MRNQPLLEIWIVYHDWNVEYRRTQQNCKEVKQTVLSRLTKLMRPDRCRLHLVPLAESNPVVKAQRHQPLWRLHLRLQAESWMVQSTVDTFNLLRLQYAPLHSIILSVTAGSWHTNPDSWYVLSSLFHLKCNTGDLPALHSLPCPHANVRVWSY